MPIGLDTVTVGSILTISGIPTDSGIYNYTVSSVGGCGVSMVSGTITVKSQLEVPTVSSNSTNCF